MEHIAMSTESNVSAELDALLSDLNTDIPAMPVAVLTDAPVIEAAPADGIVEQEGAAITAADAAPAAPVEAAPEVAADKPKGKGKGKGKKKDAAPVEPAAPTEPAAEGETPAPADAAPAEDKPKEKKERLYFSDKVERMKHRLGDQFGDFMVLELADATLEGEALKAKQAETENILKAMNVKEKNRASLLVDYAAGKSGKLNEVIGRAITILNAEGKLETGDNGNLHKNLVARPYSPGAARSMGRNTINMLAKLKVVNKTDKGVFVLNPNSLLFATMRSKMALPDAPAAAPVVETPVVEAPAPVETVTEAAAA